MITSRLNTVESINPSFWFPCQKPCMGRYIRNPTINLKLLGFLGVLLLRPVHDRWLSNDHEWDFAQREQHSADELPIGFLSQLPVFTYRHFRSLHALYKVVMETSVPHLKWRPWLLFSNTILTIIIVILVHIIDYKLGLVPCDLYTLHIHYLQMRKQRLCEPK